MTVYITISNVGADAGPFNLYSDADGYISAFEVNIPTADLEAGFASNNAPAGTTIVKVQSVNKLCNNSVNAGVVNLFFGPTPIDSVYSIDYSGDGTSAYVYGYFDGYINGVDTIPGNHIVKLNSDRSVDTSFDIGEGFGSHTVFSGASLTVVPSGQIILVGFFTSFNGDSYNRIIKLNSDGSVDNTFNIGTGFDDYTTSVQQTSDNKLIVTGIFSQYQGFSSPRVIRLNNDGTIDNTYNVGTGFNNATVFSLLNFDNSIYITGYFTEYNGTTVSKGIIKLDANGDIDPSFDGGIGFNVGNFQPIALARKENETAFYAAGYFTEYKGVAEPRIIKLLSNGDKDVSVNFGTGFNNDVSDIKLVWDDKFYIIGNFTEYNGTPTAGLVIINDDGTIHHAFPTGSAFTYVIGNNLYGTNNSTGDVEVLFTFSPVSTTTTTTTV